MAAVVSVDHVLGALAAIHEGHDPLRKQEADKWLKEFQDSRNAWEISDELLRRNVSVEASHFAAQTMKSKILYYFHELPVESHEGLRSSLFQHLFNFASNYPVMQQLCIAIADMVVYLSSWNHALRDIMTIMREPQHCISLLNFLAVLPEEVNNNKLGITAERRRQVAHDLGMESADVYPYLMQCWASMAGDVRVRLIVLQCLKNWLRFGGQGSVGVERPELGLVPALFEGLATTELQYEAGCAIESCLYLSSDSSHHAALRAALVPHVFSLVPMFQTTIAESDEDLGRVLANVFVTFTEGDIERIVIDPQYERVYELMLLCFKHPEPLVARVAFSFWFNVSDYFEAAVDNHRDRIGPYYTRMLADLIRLMTLPAALPGLLPSTDELYEFRADAKELLTDTAFIVGKRTCVQFLQSTLLAQETWNGLESCLMFMSAIAGRLNNDFEEVTPILARVLQVYPHAHVQLRHTSLTTVGLLAEWICAHEAAVVPTFQMAFGSLSDAPLSRNAAFAVKCILSAGKGQMVTLLPYIKPLFVGSQAALTNDDLTEVLKGAARVVACLSTPEAVCETAKDLCAPFIADVDAIMQGRPGKLAVPLDFLATFFHHCNVIVPRSILPNGAHPIMPLAEQAWVRLEALLRVCERDSDAIEDINHCIKWLVRCLSSFATPFLQPLVEKMSHLYQVYHYPSCLYVSSILVEVLSGDVKNAQYLYELIRAFCTATFAVLGPPENVSRAPVHVVDDFFRLVGRALDLQPTVLLRDGELCRVILQYVCHGMLLGCRETNRLAHAFLSTFITLASRSSQRDAVLPLLSASGELLIQNLTTALAGGLPSHMMPDVTELLWSMMQLARDHVVAWMRSTPALVNVRCPRVTPDHVRRLLEAVATVKEERLLREEVRHFSRLFTPTDPD